MLGIEGGHRHTKSRNRLDDVAGKAGPPHLQGPASAPRKSIPVPCLTPHISPVARLSKVMQILK